MFPLKMEIWIQTLYFVLLVNCCLAAKKPNIVFILTDDQDVVIGGMNPIAKARKMIGDEGITFSNMFVDSPLCCPSRSSIMTGRYIHNHNALNNSVSGNCSSPAWQSGPEKQAFAPHLKQAGYNTFFAGKYLNQYGFPATGGVEHIPPGWDWWIGLVGNSRYYNFALSVNGTREEHKEEYPKDYLTDIIHKRGMEFLDIQHDGGNPFFMMLSTPACHAPFTPAPQYQMKFSNESAPTGGSFNKLGKNKHWLMGKVHNPMLNDSLTYIGQTYKNRWRTLLSVDDMVEDVVNTLNDKGLLDNTYVFYSSDNGFHLGQFSLPNDKRQLYEFDIRVPLMVRGPGIKAGQTRKEMIVNIDFAPTFIQLAGTMPPEYMDGQSMIPVLHSSESLGDSYRTSFLVEHWGEYQNHLPTCPQWNGQDMSNCFPDCVCEDAKNNTYICVRTMSSEQNLIYCKFDDDVGFIEFYDMNKDPDQFNNLADMLPSDLEQEQSKRLMNMSSCRGSTCRKHGL